MRNSYSEEYKGLYHGTIKEYASEIVGNKMFIPSKSGWCGAGVYFYDNKSKAWWSAQRTCSEAKKKGNCNAVATIVTADISSLQKSYILDLRSSEDLKSFAEFVDEFLLENDFDIEDELDEVECKRLKRAMLLSFFCEEKSFKLVIGYFVQQIQEKMHKYITFADEWQLAIGIETIYCAKDPEIICNIRWR